MSLVRTLYSRGFAMEAIEILETSEASQAICMQVDWKALYRAALLEDDRSQLPQRISTARYALDNHAASLFEVGDDEERQKEVDVINRALHFLKILANHPEILSTGPAVS
jgi:hypothetical protein